ncbi:MAG: B12-binding domain-containing radical SAM protein [Methyloligella sp.]|nr:MAG: B12-binding domain-containing radical SAM protein [Methyloligella sp.]
MKLGLIAMSGVRVHNETLMNLGLTLPGFVERSKVIASLPSLALLTLAGQIPDDIETVYLEVPDLSQIEGLPEEFDAVAISSYTAQIKDAYKLADRYRKSGTTVILGGLHVTACPIEAKKHADSIVIGEAEGIWPRVMSDLKSGSLDPVYDMRASNFDLKQAPMPRFELLEIEKYNRLTVQTQRGCPFACDFCASSILLSSKFKYKPISKVIAEIRQIKQLWSKPFIELADDNSFANKAHAKRLVTAIAKEKIRWFTETDISVADDLDLLSMLRDAGCAQLLIGLEAPNKNTLNGVETKVNWKAKRAESYLEAIDRIQSKGITVNGCFILGLDGQTEDSFDDVKEFVRTSGLYDVQVTIQTPFPGTPLYDRLKSEGRLIINDPWEKCTLFDATFLPSNMSISEFEQHFHNLIEELYSDDFTKWRHSTYHRRKIKDTVHNENQ